MDQILQTLLTMTTTASVAALCVMGLRLLLKRAPRWITCLLWMVVFVRMVCPVSFSLPVSLVPAPIAQGTYVQQAGQALEASSRAQAPAPADTGGPADQGASAGPDRTDVVVGLWGAGTLGMLLWGGVSYLRLRRRTGEAIRLEGNLYETDQYKDLAKEMYAWMQEGLIQADAVNTTETATTLMSAGTAFGYFTNLKPGYDAENSSALGYEIASVDIIPALGCTNNVSRATWAISSGCKNPEAAMKVLNELYTNPELSNLYMYGIEGTHYKVLEKGGASNGQDIITWADGLDATTSNYRKSGTWLQPNQFIGDVWEGSAADIWDQQRTFNNNAQKSVAFGFTYDSATVTNEVTACTNVVSKYNKALLCGALDPDTTLDKFNEELYAAGLQNIIDEKQRQLNTWLENYGG